MAGSFKSQSNMDKGGIYEIFNLSSSVFGSFSFGFGTVKLGEVHFFLNQINEFLMVFDSCGGDDDSVMSEVGQLEFLDHFRR